MGFHTGDWNAFSGQMLEVVITWLDIQLGQSVKYRIHYIYTLISWTILQEKETDFFEEMRKTWSVKENILNPLYDVSK